jgi:hypothetical protein
MTALGPLHLRDPRDMNVVDDIDRKTQSSLMNKAQDKHGLLIAGV